MGWGLGAVLGTWGSRCPRAGRRRETQQQVQNLHRIFDALGEKAEQQSCPAIDGLKKEGEQMIKEVDENLVDSVILGGVIETEHHEVAVYDDLIIQAEQMGDDDIVAVKPDGSSMRQIPVVGATNLAVSTDGSTLAASLPAENAIAVVDTANDGLTLYPLGANACPS